MERVDLIGGGRAGGVNATWPLARLTATPNQLVLRFVLGGTYSFSPAEVVNLDPSFRWSAVAVAVLLWNALFFLDYPGLSRRHGSPGPFGLLALGLVFGVASVAKTSSAAQRLILKPGRHVGEIREALSVFQLIAGLMLVIMAWSSFGPGPRG